MRKSLLISALLGVIAACPLAQAQVINGVRVYTDTPGVYIHVDDQAYLQSQDFMWPQASKHFITIEERDQRQPDLKVIEWCWVSNLQPQACTVTQPITADPGLRWVNLRVLIAYRLTINFSPDCGGQSCTANGRVQIVVLGGWNDCPSEITQSTSCWIQKDSQVGLRAFPDTGAVFVGWGYPGSLSPSLPSSFSFQFTMAEPKKFVAQFMPATAATTTVTLQTDPQELTIIVDGTRVIAPRNLEWGWGTFHTIGTEPVQHVGSVTYAFDSWLDGGSLNRDIRVPSPAQPMTFTAHFVPAHTVRFVTSPANLRLTIDGGQDTTGKEQGWAPGSVHTISAPTTQTDTQGRRYRFVSWSNGKSAVFDYTAGPAGQSPAIVATYQLLGQATIVTSIPNLSVQVDGNSCATPCTIEKEAGTTVRVVAPLSIPNGEQSRTSFRGWADSDSAVRSLQLSGDPRTYTVRYAVQSRVSVASFPAEGASFAIDPLSSDGFYDNGSTIAVTANPALGFRILSWSGDLSGGGARVAISVDAPKSALLLLDRIPAIAPRGVRNAALGAPTLDIAPGSLISIFGANLAPVLEVGPQNPLAQALQGVTVSVDGAFLPLVFVSPGQINAQLGTSMPPGEHRISIRSSGRPETSATVNVVRNAPGLFVVEDGDQPAGAFVRQGGLAVTRERPARAGDVIEIVGTGLGAYASLPPDGFTLEESAAYRAADRVVVLLGDTEIEPLYAGRTGAGAGLDVVRFRLPDTLPDSSSAPVRIVVNDRSSNSVWLPLDR